MRKTLAILIGSLFVNSAWAATAASVVGIQGKAERRPTGTFEWKLTKAQQNLESGDFVRTGPSSQMAVLFSNKTQIRLSQNSQMQIKSLGEPATEQAAIALSAGRAWSQIKPQTGGKPAGYARVSMETPSATMSIRGTDWEVEVDPDGRTQLVVLSGSVEMGNDKGSVQVGKNEAAIAEVGKAPVKIVLTNPQARVQWVTAYRPEPWRYLLSAGGPAVAPTASALRSGEYDRAETEAAKLSGTDGLRAKAAVMVAQGRFTEALGLLEPAPADWVRSLILADLRVLGGRPEQAVELSKSAIAAAPDAAAAGVARGHLARLLIIGDRETEIPAVLEPSLKADGSADAWVAEGTRARFAGQAPRAEQAFGEAARIAPADERGWLGLGAVASEKENAKPARELLGKAAALNPREPASFAELGTLESFANRFDAAQAAFNKALELQPDDYVALTGQGIMKLKQGKTEEALEDFLKAGVMEPRYARARLYTGITYYQQGNVGRALEEFDKAAELDPKDPLPHLYASMVATDTFDAAAAVEKARAALERMPNLKSLNQVANNQKGVANVANALAFTGLKDWAMAYAQDGYYPFWAGSHLFLADFYQSPFAKKSELFQGYVSDPTNFGASNRFQTLVTKPGHYQTLTAVAARDGVVNSVVPRVTLNGYDNSYVPFAYFVDVDRQSDHERSGEPFDYTRRKDTGTLALGLAPTHELRLFGFYTASRQTNTFRTTDGSDVNELVGLRTSDLSLGASYRFSPTFMLQVRGGRSKIDGGKVTDSPFAGGPARLDQRFDDLEISRDTQIGVVYRHDDRFELAAGVEAARSPETSALRADVQPAGVRLFILPSQISERTQLAYVSGKLLFGGADYIQADLWATDYERRITGDNVILGRTTSFNETNSVGKLTGRFGATFEPWRHQRIRYAYQDWVRPSATVGLGPVATAGIGLDDTFLRFGGRQRRNVLKLESEWTPKLFSEITYDRQRVTNQRTIDTGIAELFANLTRLRQGSLGDVTNFYASSTASSSDTSTANQAGSIRFERLRLAANAILPYNLSGTLAYSYTDSQLFLDDPRFPDDRFYLPRHNVDFGLTWLSPLRYRVAFDARWRSRAWSLVNLNAPRDSYWTGAFSVYWESADKRTGLSFFAQDMFSKYDSTYYGVAANLKF